MAPIPRSSRIRVALHRIRAALSDFQHFIPAAQVSWLKRDTKWLISSLGMARDWDVFLSELLPPVEAARRGDSGLAKLRMIAETEREEGYAEAQRAIRSRRYSAFLTRMRQWLSAKSWRQDDDGLDEPVEKVADQLLTKRHRAALKLGHHFRKLSAQERHHLRITLKKLRYTAEFLRSLYQEKCEKTYLRALTQLLNSLGRMNDIVVAEHLLMRLSAARDQRASELISAGGGIVTRWYSQSASSSEQEAEANARVPRLRRLLEAKEG